MTQPLEVAMTSKEIGLEVVRYAALAQIGIGLAGICGRILNYWKVSTPFVFAADTGMTFIALGFVIGGVAFFILARRYDG